MSKNVCFWRSIPNYPDYLVSCTGDVLSLKTRQPFIMTPGRDGKGYLFLNLSNGKGKKAVRVHRLVASAFLGLELENKEDCILHLDDNPKNNNVANLKVGTQKDNLTDMRQKGRAHKTPCRFSGREISCIKTRLKNGEKGNHLAKEYEVSASLISSIKTNKRYVINQYPH